MTILDDVSAALVTAGVGQVSDATADWFIYCGYLQNTPDRAICLFESPGPPPEETMAVEYPGFQVRVRGSADDYIAARTKLRAAFDLLHGGDVSVGSAYVYVYAASSGIIPLGTDENRRSNMAMNFRVMRSRE